MMLTGVAKKYKGRFASLQPHMKDAVTNRPLSFKVLKECFHADEAVKAQEYYSAHGYSGVFIFPCFKEETTLAPAYVARMFRVLYGREG